MERTGRYSRSDRLLLSRDFQRVSRQASRFASRDFVVLVAPARNPAPHGSRADQVVPVRRLGITASRKVGNAIVRNRVKRGIREWFRHQRQHLAPDTDTVVIARAGAGELAVPDIAAALDEIVARAAKQAARRSHERRA